MSLINALYWSKKCQASALLMEMMRNEENVIKYFHLICTEDNPHTIPPQIKVTPTLIIKGINIPYVGGDAFAWLSKVKQWRNSLKIQQMGMEQQKYMDGINKNLDNDCYKVIGFSQAEMNSISDMFSYYSKDIEKEIQKPMQQYFVHPEKINQIEIFTPPLENGEYTISNKVKMSQKEHMERVKNIESKRKDDHSTMKKQMDAFLNGKNN